MEVSKIYTDSQFSEEDEESLEFSTLIFDIFDEVRIQGIVIDYLDHSFGSEDSHDIAWEMVCNNLQIHRKRFVEFI